MDSVMDWASLAVAVVAVVIAVWQGQLSKRQLKLAQTTQDETDEALAEIRELARDNKRTSDEIKRSIDDRINRILDLKLDSERSEIEARERSRVQGEELAGRFLQGAGKLFTEAMEQSKLQADGQTGEDPETRP